MISTPKELDAGAPIILRALTVSFTRIFCMEIEIPEFQFGLAG